MKKELKIYKGGIGEYKIISTSKISDRKMFIVLDGVYLMEKEDILWAKNDMERNQTKNLVVVENVNGPILTVREIDHGSVDNIRPFENGEIMTTIATFRTHEGE